MAVMGFGGAGGIQCVSAMSEIGKPTKIETPRRRLTEATVPTRWRGPVVGIIEVPFFLFTCGGSWFSMF
jgi:hypothetical protein